jgi:hypothetical protein
MSKIELINEEMMKGERWERELSDLVNFGLNLVNSVLKILQMIWFEIHGNEIEVGIFFTAETPSVRYASAAAALCFVVLCSSLHTHSYYLIYFGLIFWVICRVIFGPMTD